MNMEVFLIPCSCVLVSLFAGHKNSQEPRTHDSPGRASVPWSPPGSIPAETQEVPRDGSSP